MLFVIECSNKKFKNSPLVGENCVLLTSVTCLFRFRKYLLLLIWSFLKHLGATVLIKKCSGILILYMCFANFVAAIFIFFQANRLSQDTLLLDKIILLAAYKLFAALFARNFVLQHKLWRFESEQLYYLFNKSQIMHSDLSGTSCFLLLISVAWNTLHEFPYMWISHKFVATQC